MIYKLANIKKPLVQVNLCQKHSFLNQLYHNIMADISLIYEFCTGKIQIQNMFCTNIVLNAKTNKPVRVFVL